MLKAEFILPKKKSLNKMLGFNGEYITLILIGFFIGRASIIEKLTPFGIALIAAYAIMGRLNIYVFLSVILGIFTIHGFSSIDYLFGAFIIALLFNSSTMFKEFSLIKSALISGGIFSVTKLMLLLLFKDIFIYDIFIILFEGLIVFTLTYIFSHSIFTESSAKYTNEKIICIFITLSLVLSGLHNLSIFGVSIKNIISIVLILYFGFSQGALMGGVIGITLGMVSYSSQLEMPFILSIYGLAGMLTGIFKDLGKAGSVLGFLLGNGIISFYINGYGTSFIDIKELVLSIIVFIFMYEILEKHFSNYLNMGKIKEGRSHSNRKDEMTIDRLNEISKVFKELGGTFKKSVECSNNHDMGKVYGLIDEVANSICVDCGMRKFCWEEGFYTTYYALFNMVSLMEENKTLTDDNLPSLIKDYCINKENIKKDIKKHFDVLKTNNIWENRILENRLLVSEQLEGIAKIVENMAKEIYVDPIFKEDVEEILWANLKNNKIDVVDVVVAELRNNKTEIHIEIDKIYKVVNDKENIKKIVSNSLNIPFKIQSISNSSDGKRQRFKLIRNNRFSAVTEVAMRTSNFNNISGDNYTFGEGENSYFVALSDGMGIGKRANNESSIAINLFEKFLEAKFDKELTLKTINSILMLKSNDEAFTTFDISLLDLYLGKLQIIKTGAPATFIKKKDRVKLINSKSLPVGILKDVDFNVYEEYLEDGDIIIMMSDGILEANEDTGDSERWMKDIIMDIDSQNPKTIANRILNVAENFNSKEAKDDMTVLVTKVWKTVGA